MADCEHSCPMFDSELANKIEVTLARIDERQDAIHRELFGNGREGLVKTVARHDRYIERLDARVVLIAGLIMALGGAAAAAVIEALR